RRRCRWKARRVVGLRAGHRPDLEPACTRGGWAGVDPVSGDQKHCKVPAAWGAQLYPMGDRTALAVQRAREAIAFALNLVPGVQATAPPTKAAQAARERAR